MKNDERNLELTQEILTNIKLFKFQNYKICNKRLF